MAEPIGYGMTGDGIIRVIRRAIKDAGIAPEQLDYINAHATSTPVGDPLEVRAIKTTLGAHAQKIAISSTKSMTGHLLGGAGGLEAGISVMAMIEQIASPTINLDNPRRRVRSRLHPAQGSAHAHRLRAVESIWIRRDQWVPDFQALV